MGNRRKSREFALQLLFQEDVAKTAPEEITEHFWESNQTDPETRRFAELLFSSFIDHREKIDNLIEEHAQNWKLARMAIVDRNILRMAISEFLFTETPPIVVIDEAIEVARRYSGDESTEFVNGILDAVKKNLDPPPQETQS